MRQKRTGTLTTVFLVLVNFFIVQSVHAGELPGPLVDSKWLAENKDTVAILDVRKDIKSFTSKPVLTKDKKTGQLKIVRVGGHIPGARLLDYKKLRTKRNIDGMVIDKMILPKKDFEKLIRQAGVNQDSTIVIVSKGQDSVDMTMATRLYWQLKYFGHDKMAILNGGMSDWLLGKYPISLKPVKTSEGSWMAGNERKQILATSAEVENALKDSNVQLVDNRTLDLYLGTHKKSYVYAKGHIPGAKLLSHNLLTAPSVPSGFLPNDELSRIADALDVNMKANSITYCNSGHLASGGWFVMSELFGNQNVKLYDGSMHEWTKNKKRPVSYMKME